MEVLFVSHKHPPSIGGIQNQNAELVNGFARFCRVHRLIWDHRSSRARFMMSAAHRAARILRAFPSISLVHACDALMGVFLLPLAKRAEVPIAVTVHGLDLILPNRVYQQGFIQRLRELDGVIPVSASTAEACRQRSIPDHKLFVVNNGVDTSLAAVKRDPAYRARLERRLGFGLADRKLLVCAGRPVRRKGLSWFLEHVLPGLDEDVVFLMVGPRPPHMGLMENLLDRLPGGLGHQLSLLLALPLDVPRIGAALKNPALRGRAFELGPLPFDEVIQTLLHADLFVMPNVPVAGDMEGFGLVALEASACGLPVVASRLEGITDAVIHDQNGVWVEAGDHRAWITTLRKLLADRRALQRRGEQGRAFTCARYSWERMVDDYLGVFRRIIAAKGAP